MRFCACCASALCSPRAAPRPTFSPKLCNFNLLLNIEGDLTQICVQDAVLSEARSWTRQAPPVASRKSRPHNATLVCLLPCTRQLLHASSPSPDSCYLPPKAAHNCKQLFTVSWPYPQRTLNCKQPSMASNPQLQAALYCKQPWQAWLWAALGCFGLLCVALLDGFGLLQRLENAFALADVGRLGLLQRLDLVLGRSGRLWPAKWTKPAL